MRLIVTNPYVYVEGGKHAQFLVRHSLKYLVPGHEVAVRKVGKHRWDGTKSLHDSRKCRFPSGLIKTVTQYLDSIGCSYETVDARKREPRPVWPVCLSGIELRDYQSQSVVKFLNSGRGILQLATGAGKTEVAVAIAKSIGQPMMFLTHRVNLLYQSAERFTKRWPECRSRIGIIGDGSVNFNDLSFATVQTLHGIIKRYGDKAIDELRRYKLMVVDEAHRIGSTQFHECAGSLTEAYWRLGLTATPFMSENPADNMHLLGAIGDVVHKVSATQLIEAGVLARPFFKFFVINSPDMKGIKNWRDIYEKGIIQNNLRNRIISDNTIKLVKMGYKPLVIVTEVSHGKRLTEAICAGGAKADLVSGDDDVSRRIHALKSLSDGRLQAIVCTNIFDEGIDVNDVSAIVLAAGTKSAPALFQRTGRAIRAKEDGENRAIIIDFIDRQHPTLEKHSMMRYSMVKSEPGFTIM